LRLVLAVWGCLQNDDSLKIPSASQATQGGIPLFQSQYLSLLDEVPKIPKSSGWVNHNLSSFISVCCIRWWRNWNVRRRRAFL